MLLIAARVIGVLFLLVGILGFIRALSQPGIDAPHVVIGSTVFLLGLFAVNVVHNIVHIIVGLWGLVSSRTQLRARSFFRNLAILYGLLVILGLIPLTSTLFGLAPIGGADVWLHVLTTAVAFYFGWRVPLTEEEAAA